MAIINAGSVGFVPRGAYNDATVYKFMDMVSENGSSYFYKNKTPSSGHPVTDTVYWDYIAIKGETGSDGLSPVILTSVPTVSQLLDGQVAFVVEN